MKIMECQLFPVLAYGCHLWNFEKSSLVTSVNTAYRKGVRRGLGMRKSDSIVERLPGYIESAVNFSLSFSSVPLNLEMDWLKDLHG